MYCLTSSADDLYEAITLVSLRTVRRTNPRARITVVCDQQTHEALEKSGSPLLAEVDATTVVKTPDGSDGYRNRFLKMQLAERIRGPFLFLDGDTVVRGSLDSLWTLRADIAEAPNHSLDSFEEQIWDQDLAHLQQMGWQVNPPYFNAGVIWYRGNGASRHFAVIWHRYWLESVERSHRWRDQTAFNHALAQLTDLHIHCLDHRWNAQYRTTPSSAEGACIWHAYSPLRIDGSTPG